MSLSDETQATVRRLSVLVPSRTKRRRAIERKNDDLFADDSADIVMQTDNFATGDCLDQRFQCGSGNFDQSSAEMNSTSNDLNSLQLTGAA